jgi:hypothetical protein
MKIIEKNEVTINKIGLIIGLLESSTSYKLNERYLKFDCGILEEQLYNTGYIDVNEFKVAQNTKRLGSYSLIYSKDNLPKISARVEYDLDIFLSSKKNKDEVDANLNFFIKTNKTIRKKYIMMAIILNKVGWERNLELSEFEVIGFFIYYVYHKEFSFKKITSVKDIVNYNKFLDNGKELFFRGQGSTSFAPIPSLLRGDLSKEKFLFNELIRYCPDEFSGFDNNLDCLVKMQHYGLSTRMLDLTSNILVALYFACSDSEQKTNDAELLIFKISDNRIKTPRDEETKIFTSLSQLTFEDLENVSKGLIKENLKRLIDTSDYFTNEEITKLLSNQVLYVKPNLSNNRILKQSGSFIIFGINDFKDHTSNNDLIIETVRKDLFDYAKTRFIIPWDFKNQILDELEFLNISKMTLFPEIENVSEIIKKKYLI